MRFLKYTAFTLFSAPIIAGLFLSFLVLINHLASWFYAMDYHGAKNQQAAFQFFYEQGVQAPPLEYVGASIIISLAVYFSIFKVFSFLFKKR